MQGVAGETRGVVSAREAPPLSAPAGPGGFVPARPHLFPPSTFIYRPRVQLDAYTWGVPSNRVDEEVERLRLVQLERRLEFSGTRETQRQADHLAWSRFGR